MLTSRELASYFGNNKPARQNRLATVVEVVEEHVAVQIDGETTPSPAKYANAIGLSLSVGNRVLLVATETTYIIVCKITS